MAGYSAQRLGYLQGSIRTQEKSSRRNGCTAIVKGFSLKVAGYCGDQFRKTAL